MGHSARRRADLQRMKAKARKIYPHDNRATWANHLQGCSCAMCGNQRRSRLNSGESKLTMQERKALWAERADA